MKAAGGSVTDVTVSFTVRPVIVLVVDDSGRPLAVWSNLGHQPTAGQLAGLRVAADRARRRPGTTPALRAPAAAVLDAADWSRRGRIWVT